MSALKTFLRLPAVIAVVGMQRTAIYGAIKAGKFPSAIQIGPRAVAWDAADIAQWQDQRIDATKARVAK